MMPLMRIVETLPSVFEGGVFEGDVFWERIEIALRVLPVRLFMMFMMFAVFAHCLPCLPYPSAKRRQLGIDQNGEARRDRGEFVLIRTPTNPRHAAGGATS